LPFDYKNRWSNRGPRNSLDCGSKHEETNLLTHELFLVQADTFIARLLGLLGKRTIEPSHALWLKPCSSVHTFGMRFSIGVFFIDKHGVIVKTIAQLKPNRVAICLKARSVVETAAFEKDRTEEMKSALLRELIQD
jgi:uncharacterized membrane protein (UPF0127 family)